MLIALIFRGIAFEFRFKSRRTRRWWDLAFAGGSLMAALMQGVILGGFIQGVPVVDRQFAGSPFDWLDPFAVFTGISVVIGYAMLGAGWLVMKTETALQEWVRALMRPLSYGLLIAIAVVSLWTPLLDDTIARRWFSWPNILYLSPVPLLVMAVAWRLGLAVRKEEERAPFLLTLALFLLSYGGLAISLWPHIIPPDVTIWQAASPRSSQVFLLVGTAVLIPVILCYTGYSYWVFRGKVGDEGYH